MRFAMFFIRPLKNPPLLLGLAFAILVIKSTIIPSKMSDLKSFKKLIQNSETSFVKRANGTL